MKLRSATVALIVVACGACTGGGGGGGGVTKADLVAALRKGTDQTTAECVADGLLDAELTQAELQEFASFSGADELPSRTDVYDSARAACGPSTQPRRGT